MASNSRSNKKPKSETFLVAGVDVAMPLGGTTITNPANFDLNIDDGQLAVICATHDSPTRAYGVTIDTSDDCIEVPTIQILQGTPNSADIRGTYPLDAISDKALVRSQKITARNGLVFTGRVSSTGTRNAWVLGGTGGAFPIEDEGDYALNLQFVSHRNDKWFGAHGEEDLTVNFTAPVYSTAGLADNVDHLVKNVVYNANLNSEALRFNNPGSRRGNKNFIAFAVDEDGAGGGTTLSSITAGVAFDVAVDASSTTVSYIPDQLFVDSIAEVIANSANVTGASTIVVADLTTAGAGAADVILVVATDHRLAVARDDIAQVRVRLRVGFEYISFTANPVNKEEVSRPYEGDGQGRKMKLWYDSRAGLNIYTAQNRHWGPQEYITPPSYIDTSVDYNAYIIEHKESYLVPASHEVDWFHRTVILVPTAFTTVIASLNTVLTTWLNSARDANYVERRETAGAVVWFD